MALLVPLMLTACAAPAEGEPEPEAISSSPESAGEETDAVDDELTPAPSTGAGNSSFVLADERISFELGFCSIDETDIVAHGPGEDEASGEPSYLSVGFARETSSTSGEARVDLGATTEFQSMDDFYVFTTAYLPGEYTITIDGDSFVLEAEFRDADGSLIGPGTLAVDCR